MEVCRVLHSLSHDKQDVVPVKDPVNILERVNRHRQVIVYHRPVAEKQLFDLPVYQVVGGDERTVISFEDHALVRADDVGDSKVFSR